MRVAMSSKLPPSFSEFAAFEPGSFRDRNGRVYYDSGRVFRLLSEVGLADWETASSKRFFQQAMRDGKIVGTRRIEETSGISPGAIGGWAGVLEHDRIPFVSYPYEWSFGMLQDAALLQLELLDAALDEDMVLKDASAFNVQWTNGRPVFIDVLSFENLEPGQPWVGYRQFCQMFLYPLLLQAYKNVPFQPWLRGNLEGIDPEQFNQLMSLRDLFRPGVLFHVYLHAKSQRRHADRDGDVRAELHRAGFHKALIKANVARLRKLVAGLRWKAQTSQWHDYTTRHSYSEEDLHRKISFVQSVVTERHRHLVWDLGCNTGTFSELAAENADCVIAMDSDGLIVERLYQAIKSNGQSRILPLLINIADPPPNLGWRARERHGLAERGKPDLVLCLALLHHLVISANIPVAELVDWLASLQADLVIEFVTKDDPMVRKLLQNKVDNYFDYQLAFFEHCLSRAFVIERRENVTSNTRILYYAKIKS